MAKRYGIFIKNDEGQERQLKPSWAVKVKGFLRRRRAKAVYTQAVKKYGKGNVEGKRKPKKVSDAELILKWLSGDLDCDARLLLKLAYVAKYLDTPLYINSGKRSFSEQKALFLKYGSPRAARPGTSRHETGLAADVVKDSDRRVNMDQIPSGPAALKRYGLSLPVAGEGWHVELVS